MRVLLTGASGFLGRRLVAKLAGLGHELVALVRSPIVSLHVEQWVLPALEGNGLASALDGRAFDAFVNVAAAGVRPDDRAATVLTEINALLPCLLLNHAKQCGAGAFIHIGSSSEYAAQSNFAPLSENAPLENSKLYGATKAAGTLLASAHGKALDLPVACLRLFNIFGPGEADHRLFPSLVSRLQRHERVPLSAGNQIRDFMHIDDACDAIVTALLGLKANSNLAGIYNVASGEGTSVRGFASQVARCVGNSDTLLDFGAVPLRADDLPFVVGDPSAFKNSFGWSPSMNLHGATDAAVFEMLAQQSNDQG